MFDFEVHLCASRLNHGTHLLSNDNTPDDLLQAAKERLKSGQLMVMVRPLGETRECVAVGSGQNSSSDLLSTYLKSPQLLWQSFSEVLDNAQPVLSKRETTPSCCRMRWLNANLLA